MGQKLVSDATGRNALIKLNTSLQRIVEKLGEPAAKSASPEPEAEAGETAVEEPVAEGVEESVAEEATINDEEPSVAGTIQDQEVGDLIDSDREDEKDDEDALAAQLHAEATRVEESTILSERPRSGHSGRSLQMELPVRSAPTSRETSVLGAGAVPGAGRPKREVRESRRRDSLVDELLSDEDEDETL